MKLLKLSAVVLALALTFFGCAHPRHVLVVVDQSMFQAISTINKADQQALCQQDACVVANPDGTVQQLSSPVPGLSLDKSRAFEKTLLIAATTGQQFNAILASWVPGTPMPAQLHTLVGALSD